MSKKTTTILSKVKNPEVRDLLNKVNDETETFKVLRVGRDVSKLITEARIQKKWKREQLARAMNMPISMVADHENGTAIYQPANLIKFERVLGIHLPRPA